MPSDPAVTPSVEAARLVRLHGIGYPDYALLASVARIEAEREAALEGMEAAWDDVNAAESLVSLLCLLFRWQAARIAWLAARIAWLAARIAWLAARIAWLAARPPERTEA